jgi:membrane associated rhomboid family serine protease
MMPLFIEAALMALAGFAVGLLFAYLVELRRRSARSRRF